MPKKRNIPCESKKILVSFLFSREALMLFILSIFVLFIYSNTFHVPFIFDDEANILKNPYIRLTKLDWRGVMDAGFKSICHNRPVANISFALNYYLHQYNLPGYHLVNIIIHIITAILLYFFTKLTLEISRNKDSTPEGIKRQEPWLIAFLTAAVWATNPVQTQAITYIVQRMTSMAAMFFILAMLMYVKGRLVETGKKKWAFFGLSILSGLLAMGSKEISATLPFFIFLYEWYFLQDLDKAWFKRKIIPLACVVALFAIVGLVYLGGHPIERILKGYETRNFTPPQRVLTEFRVVIFYISLFLFPHPSRLNLDHYISISHSLFDPITTFISLITILALIGLALYLAKKERIISFCILWFFGNLVIESSVIGLELIFEHRLYLPSMMLSLLLVLLAFRYVKPRWIAIGIIGAIVVLGSTWTYQRNTVWQTALSLWQDCARKSPEKARPYTNIGIIFGKYNNPDVAIKYFSKALKIDPNSPEACNDMGYALLRKGKIDEAITYLAKAIKIAPAMPKANNNLGLALATKGKIGQAIKYFSTAVKLEPLNSEAWNNLGLAQLRTGDIDGAVKSLSNAIKINPDYAEAHENLGAALIKQGNLDEAIRQLSNALRIRPNYAEAYNLLGVALIRKKEFTKAIIHFQKAVSIDPQSKKARKNLKAALSALTKINNAISEVKKALATDPKNAALYKELGKLYRERGDLDKAISEYKKALSIKPDSIEILNNLAVIYAAKCDYEKALIELKRIIELRPSNPDVYYNIACIYSRQDKVDEAVSWLKKAIDKGFDNWKLIRKDPDLRNIRGTEYYKELVQRHK